jgi:hypothetical protein
MIPHLITKCGTLYWHLALFRKLRLTPQCSARELRWAAARSCDAHSLVETMKMIHDSSQNLLETLPPILRAVRMITCLV